jgi:hypothetical protein
MAGYITLPQAIMSVVGGVPVQPAGAKTIIENLRAAKSMIPGDMGGILSQVMQNGPGALLQNPIGSVLGSMQSQVGNLASSLTGMSGMSGLLSAVTGAGGLQSALGNLSQVSSALSGLTQPGAGAFGLMDAIGHANIVSMLGSNLPAGLGIAQAMGPVLMGGQLSGMLSQVSNIASAVSGSSFDVNSAISQITGMTGTINGVLSAHTNAFTTVQNAVVDMAHASGIVSLIASGPAEFAPIANMLIQPQFVAQIQAAITAQQTPDPVSAPPSDQGG